MRIAEKGGLTELLSKALSPLMRLLFPKLKPDGPACRAILMNMAANFLGLGNAATPFGLKAMNELEKENPIPGTASNSMVVFVVLNTASIQLIPTTVATLRLQYGSAQPMRILPAVWAASFLTALAAVDVYKRQSTADIVKLLCSGATRRNCRLLPENARLLVEQCGDDLNLLLNELDKLCALAGEGEITREMIESAGSKNLEASVFDLSKAILQNHYARAYAILHRLLSQKEEPVNILAVLSTAYADLYRAKVAAAAGKQADTLTADFQYRGREFRLRNAARDASRLSMEDVYKRQSHPRLGWWRRPGGRLPPKPWPPFPPRPAGPPWNRPFSASLCLSPMGYTHA